MTVVIVVTSAFALVALVAVLVHRGDRASGARRRDLERVQRDYRQAQLTLHIIQRSITLWRPSVTDPVGLGFMDAVQEQVTAFHAAVLRVEDDDQKRETS